VITRHPHHSTPRSSGISPCFFLLLLLLGWLMAAESRSTRRIRIYCLATSRSRRTSSTRSKWQTASAVSGGTRSCLPGPHVLAVYSPSSGHGLLFSPVVSLLCLFCDGLSPPCACFCLTLSVCTCPPSLLNHPLANVDCLRNPCEASFSVRCVQLSPTIRQSLNVVKEEHRRKWC
jgi:hypothetical protein